MKNKLNDDINKQQQQQAEIKLYTTNKDTKLNTTTTKRAAIQRATY